MIPELSNIEASDIPDTQSVELKIHLKSKSKGVYELTIDGKTCLVFFKEEGGEKIVRAKSEWGQKELEIKECESCETKYLREESEIV
jgi:hypothetical protein